MIQPRGPGEPFTALFDEQSGPGRRLPVPFHTLYSAWPLPDPVDHPLTFVNFVMSHDGRVSFNAPGHMGGGDVSRRDTHDRWLMGLLRARADAVLVGGSSIATAGNHVWTPAAVFPEDAAAFAALRSYENRAAVPLLVVLTRSGALPEHAPALDNPDLPVLVATTQRGAEQARRILGARDWINYLPMGEQVHQRTLMQRLHADFGVNHLLVEGGPQIYAALLNDGLIDDAFTTLSPIMIGATDAQRRPSLIEGVAFGYVDPPQMQLLSLHRHGSHLYLHARYER